MALAVPVAGVEEVEAAEFQPGARVVRGGGEVAAQQLGGLPPLAAAREGGGPRRDARIHGRLREERSRQQERSREGGEPPGAGEPHESPKLRRGTGMR